MPRITKSERDELYHLLSQPVREALQQRDFYREQMAVQDSITPSKELAAAHREYKKLLKKEHFIVNGHGDLRASDKHPECLKLRQDLMDERERLQSILTDIKFSVLNYNGDFTLLQAQVKDLLKKAGF